MRAAIKKSRCFKRKTLRPFPIFLDSPMAIRATDIYRSHPELFDDEAIAMRRSGDLSGNLRSAGLPESSGLVRTRAQARSLDGARRRGHVHGRPHNAPPESSARPHHAAIRAEMPGYRETREF